MQSLWIAFSLVFGKWLAVELPLYPPSFGTAGSLPSAIHVKPKKATHDRCAGKHFFLEGLINIDSYVALRGKSGTEVILYVHVPDLSDRVLCVQTMNIHKNT